MKWADIGRKIAGAGLPSLGGALGGPAGAIVGAEVARRLGLPGANPEAVAERLKADPAALAKLREIEVSGEIETAKLEVQDRMDARTHIRDDRMRRVLAIFLPIAALTFGSGLCAALIWRGLITEAVGIAGTMLGWLIRDASAASAFYFGTSIGSSRKAAELAQERKP